MDEVPQPIVDRMVDRARLPGASLTIGRYVVVGELGRGGMGVVYEGWDPGIERRVAIKTVEPDLVPEEDRDEVVERFRRETKVVGRLKHRAIVTVFDSGRQRAVDPVTGDRYTSHYYYVMEFIDGRSLASLLREQGRLPEVQALRIVVDIAEALQMSHDASIIHRDIKPSNIFLRDGVDAVLLDFGIAKTGSVALTRQGQILGTPSYLAPERLREKDVAIDGRADIFSLGVLLYTMITGEAPFVGEDVYDVIDKIARESHPKVARQTPAGAALADVIDRMLAKRPQDRFPSAGDAAVALQAVLRHFEDDQAAADAFEELSDSDYEDLEDLEKTSPSAPTPMPEGADAFVSAELDAFEAEIQEIAALAEPGQPATEQMPGLSEPPAPAAPVRVAELEGTRPELALMRKTRELQSGQTPVIQDVADFDGPDDTSPSVPPGVLQAVTAGGASEAHAYVSHAPENDESTDDETVADPAFRVPSSIRNTPIVRAHQRQIATEQVVRASNPAHSEQATEASTPIVAEPRARRSRIEASLVDEDDVVVQPAPLDSMNPDELPTQTGFEIPQGSDSRPEIIDRHEVKTRGDVDLPDPAESHPDRQLPVGAANLRARELELSEVSGAVPELDVKKSAAVARRTIGPAPSRDASRAKAASPRGSADPILDGFERSKMLRRRAFLLVSATLMSVALGLLLGRLNRKEGPASPPKKAGLVTVDPAAPVAEPRDRVRAMPGSGQPDLVRPRPASELIKDAEGARLSGHLDDAARLFESAIRASADESNLRAKALLGRADVLRQLGQQEDAIRLYRMVAKGHADSPQAEQAKVALQELGRPLRRRRRTTRVVDAPAPPPQKAPAPKRRPAIDTSATPQAQCKAIMKQHLSSPRGAILSLQRMKDRLPNEPCVRWHLANKYEQLNQLEQSVREYQRYLKLVPNSPRRAAVQRRVRDLQARLRQ